MPRVVRCRIARVLLPPGHDVDTGDLARQVSRELARLLAAGQAGALDGTAAGAAGHVRLQLHEPPSTASVAHAIAGHLYRQLSDRPQGAR